MINFRSFVQKQLKNRSIRIQRMPSALLDNPEAELMIGLDLVGTHLVSELSEVVFVQVGANDGVMADSFLPVAAKLGWKGLLIEPQPEAFRSLQEKFSGNLDFRCINAAVDVKSQTRQLYRIKYGAPVPAWAHGLASFSFEHVKSHESHCPGLSGHIESIDVECKTFEQILGESGVDDFDALQIDAEGYDYEILKLANISKRRTRLVNFEHRHLSLVDWDAATRLLVSNGFQVAKTGADTLAYRAAGSEANGRDST